MSVVSNVILIPPLHLVCLAEIHGDDREQEDRALAALNQHIAAARIDGGFVRIPARNAPGSKVMECDVCAGGFNYLDDEALIKCLLTFPWAEREFLFEFNHLQLFIQHDAPEDPFREIDLSAWDAYLSGNGPKPRRAIYSDE